MNQKLFVRADCRHFRADRPCRFHKETGVECRGCRDLDPVRQRLCIVKLDALGDVLRTTSILTGLKRKYPASHITWLTLENALPVLAHLPEVDRALAVDSPRSAFVAENTLAVERFDLLINLDAAPKSAGLASRVQAAVKKGFGLKADGSVFPFNPEAQAWFDMGVNDRLKKRNTKTYQSLMARIVGIPEDDMPILVRLTDGEKDYAAKLFRSLGADPRKITLGLNAGSGTRWPLKRWTTEKYAQLLDRLASAYGKNVNFLLLGGPEEKEINARIMKLVRRAGVLDTGTGHTLRQFMAVVNLCDIVLTADTICLHIACGLGKQVTAVFGPTSASEIELYGRGRKIFAPNCPCLCCYRGDCGKKTTCMDLLSVDDVEKALVPLLKKPAGKRSPR